MYRHGFLKKPQLPVSLPGRHTNKVGSFCSELISKPWSGEGVTPESGSQTPASHPSVLTSGRLFYFFEPLFFYKLLSPYVLKIGLAAGPTSEGCLWPRGGDAQKGPSAVPGMCKCSVNVNLCYHSNLLTMFLLLSLAYP